MKPLRLGVAEVKHAFSAERADDRVFCGACLIAASIFDVGQQPASSIYGIFDPDKPKRSLGIFIMLLEIQHYRESGLRRLYPGYAAHEPSAYDYKNSFTAPSCSTGARESGGPCKVPGAPAPVQRLAG